MHSLHFPVACQCAKRFCSQYVSKLVLELLLCQSLHFYFQSNVLYGHVTRLSVKSTSVYLKKADMELMMLKDHITNILMNVKLKSISMS